MYLQARLLGRLGRSEEQRDFALSALESPFWTLGVSVGEVQGAAGLSHVPNLRALLRGMEQAAREKQGEPPPSEAEAALTSALDALDDVALVQGEWEAVRPRVAELLRVAGLADSALVAEGGGELYPWPVGAGAVPR